MADEQLQRFRSSIDNIDAALILLLAERFKVTEDVGEYTPAVEAQQGLPPADPEREKEQIARLRQLASSSNLDPTFSEAFLRLVIDEVIRRHERAADKP